ncbi:MAG: cysteine desulfurase family protein, partial [Candidatus Ranarchaeia archaeon]
MFVYLDHAAGYPVDRRVIDEMLPYFSEHYGNPASFHSEGFDAVKALSKARMQVAGLINAFPEEIIFTSGATEANNLALLGVAERVKKKGNKVVISSIEHISVINIAKELTRRGFEVVKCPVSESGIIDIDELENLVDDDTVLVSIMVANGEIGSIQPLEKIAGIAHEHDVFFHSDATAAFGKISLDVKSLNIDLMTLSSNDIYGPKGVGALYLRKGVRIKPQMIGGGQEKGLRSGSENVPGIVGMGKAAELTVKEMV